MSKSRDKRLAIQRADRPLSERYSTDVLHLLADRHLTKEREQLLSYRDEIAALEADNERLTEQVAFLKGQLVEVSMQKVDEINRRAALEEGGNV